MVNPDVNVKPIDTLAVRKLHQEKVVLSEADPGIAPAETFVPGEEPGKLQIATFNMENLLDVSIEDPGTKQGPFTVELSGESQRQQPGTAAWQRPNNRQPGVDLNRLYFEDEVARQAFLDEVNASPMITPEMFEISSETASGLTQSMVEHAAGEALKGKDVVITLSDSGVASGFSHEQTQQLAEAGVKVQVHQETLDSASATTGLNAMKAAGIPVKVYTSPWGGESVVHQKMLILDDSLQNGDNAYRYEYSGTPGQAYDAFRLGHREGIVQLKSEDLAKYREQWGRLFPGFSEANSDHLPVPANLL